MAVLGETGCGKSTLLRLILGQEFPTDGSVMVDGKWLMRGRKLLTIDEELLKQKVMQNAAGAARGAKIPEEQRWPVH